MIYRHGNEVRRVRMNQPHPAQVTPSWYGDSVGHYEGDTLVIDTVGIKIGPFAMVDMYGTPHSPALHVVERYRLVDYDDAKDAMERNAKENSAGRAGTSTPTTGARCCSSILRSRMKASSRCPGRRPSRIGPLGPMDGTYLQREIRENTGGRTRRGEEAKRGPPDLGPGGGAPTNTHRAHSPLSPGTPHLKATPHRSPPPPPTLVSCTLPPSTYFKISPPYWAAPR